MVNFDINNPATYSASALLKNTLDSWGLSALYKDAMDLLHTGLDGAAIILELEKTDTYKKRFIANEDRRKHGLPVLSPAEYVSLEAGYRTVLQQFGLPKGFYDKQDDFHKFIGNNISPEQLAQRAQKGQQIMLAHDPFVLSEYQRLWGVGADHVLASILDPEAAMPLVDRQVQAALLGSRAQRAGLEVLKGQLEGLADIGTDVQQATAGFGEVGRTLPTDNVLAERYGFGGVTQAESISAQFTNLPSARRKIGAGRQAEVNEFGAGAAASNAALGTSSAGRY